MAAIGIDHVVIRVKDIDEGIANYQKMGYTLSKQLETPGIGKQAIFRFPNGTFIELVAPLSPDSAVGKAIESRGEGVHSIVVKTEKFKDSLQEMTDNGVTVIQSEDLPDNAFVHPKSSNGVLVQIQKAK